MTHRHPYTVVLRGPGGRLADTIKTTIQARHGAEAHAEALAMAAQTSQARGVEYRVARVDPS